MESPESELTTFASGEIIGTEIILLSISLPTVEALTRWKFSLVTS